MHFTVSLYIISYNLKNDKKTRKNKKIVYKLEIKSLLIVYNVIWYKNELTKIFDCGIIFLLQKYGFLKIIGRLAQLGEH